MRESKKNSDKIMKNSDKIMKNNKIIKTIRKSERESFFYQTRIEEECFFLYYQIKRGNNKEEIMNLFLFKTMGKSKRSQSMSKRIFYSD